VANAPFLMRPPGTRGAIVNLPIFADGIVEALILQVKPRPSIMRSNATSADVEDFEAHLSVSGAFNAAPEEERQVALLALWMHSFVPGAVSPAAVNGVSRDRVNNLIRSVAAARPQLVTEPGSWNLPASKCASTGRLGHALFYADIPLAETSLGSDLLATLVAQAGDELLTAPEAAHPFSLAEAVLSLNRYQAAAWATRNPSFAASFANRVAKYPQDYLPPLLGLALQSRTVVSVIGGGKIVDDSQRPEAARRILCNVADQRPGSLAGVPDLLALPRRDTLAQQWTDQFVHRGRRHFEDVLAVVHTMAILGAKNPSQMKREFLEHLLQVNVESSPTRCDPPNAQVGGLGPLLVGMREMGLQWDSHVPEATEGAAVRQVGASLERIFGPAISQYFQAECLAEKLRDELQVVRQAGKERGCSDELPPRRRIANV
jgi:hypothetical protein